jgi:ubiquinone/menaquinone biosynthesis C-methylase UbiE
MPRARKEIPAGFDTATRLPASEAQRREWQAANRKWWEDHPMSYDHQPVPQGAALTAEFFRAVDERFFSSARDYLPPRCLPFDRLIEFASLSGQDVLEIGVGMGCHAQLLACHARSFVGIDLTGHATRGSATRFRQQGLPARILQMDAEKLAFPDSTFDLVWSWGVIHHSADTVAALREIHRVLRPGGSAVVMVYHRNWLNYQVAPALRALARGRRPAGSRHLAAQAWTDGALARHYTAAEWRRAVAPFFTVEELGITGLKAEVVLLPAGPLKEAVSGLLPSVFTRFLTNNLRLGSFLVTRLRKV